MLAYPLRSSKFQIVFLKKVFFRGMPQIPMKRCKTIFGHPMSERVESTSLLCFYQNEIIKEMKASLDANFRSVLNLSSSINGHVLSQNRRINAIDKKISLFFPNTKDGNTQIYPCFYAQLGALNDITCWEETNFIFVS